MEAAYATSRVLAAAWEEKLSAVRRMPCPSPIRTKIMAQVAVLDSRSNNIVSPVPRVVMVHPLHIAQRKRPVRERRTPTTALEGHRPAETAICPTPVKVGDKFLTDSRYSARLYSWAKI